MSQSGCMSFKKANLKRRDFLRVGSLSLLGISLSDFFRMQSVMASQGLGSEIGKAKAQSCILIWLSGGPSHIDMWDPKPNSSFRPISTNAAGIQISELLPKVSNHMDKLAIIRSMHSEEIDHPEATHYAITGHRQNPAMAFPSLGSIITKEMKSLNGIPPYVMAPEITHPPYREYFSSAFLGAEYDPLSVPKPKEGDFELPDLALPKSISVDRIEERIAFQEVIDQLYRKNRTLAEFTRMDTFTAKAMEMILDPAVKEAFDLSKESEATRDLYGRHGMGQSTLLACRLVEAGSRFVTVSADYSWDSHSKNDEELRDKTTPPLDQALSALLEDLKQRGLLESTIVVTMGEFGRTPHINPDNGRDHWPHCWSMVIGGGGIQGGQVVGASDERGAYVAERMVTIGDLYATIYKAMGIDWEKTYMTPIGRPIKIATSIGDETGVPIHEII